MSLAATRKFGLPFRFSTDATEGPLHNAAATLGDLDAVIKSYAGRLDAILADPDMSPAGRAKALSKLRAETLAKDVLPYATGQGIAVQLKAAINTLKAQLPKLAPAKDDAAGAVRGMELRSWLRGMDEQGRLAVLKDAMAANDTDVLAAFLTAPAAMRLANPQVLDEVHRRVVRAAAPQLADNIDRHEEASRAIDGALGYVADAIDEGALPHLDPAERAGIQKEAAARHSGQTGG